MEDKAILHIALCGYLPYGVKLEVPKNISINALRLYGIEQEYKSTFHTKRNGWICTFWNHTFANIEDIKPYLFPITSLTNTQRKILKGIGGLDYTDSNEIHGTVEVLDLLDEWLVDYRGLIERNLAIDATNKHIYEL